MKLKTIYRAMVPVMAAFTACNLALVGFVWWRLRHPVEYNVRYIEPPKFELPAAPTNAPLASESILPRRLDVSSPVVPAPVQPRVWVMKYHYCVVAGRRTAFLNGVKVQEGDIHAFGVVRDIYPERIYFEGGCYIENEMERRMPNASSSPADYTVP